MNRIPAQARLVDAVVGIHVQPRHLHQRIVGAPLRPGVERGVAEGSQDLGLEAQTQAQGEVGKGFVGVLEIEGQVVARGAVDHAGGNGKRGVDLAEIALGGGVRGSAPRRDQQVL